MDKNFSDYKTRISVISNLKSNSHLLDEATLELERCHLTINKIYKISELAVALVCSKDWSLFNDEAKKLEEEMRRLGFIC